MGAVYSQKDKISPKVADTSRNLIGDERTARIESWFFVLQDRVDRLKYRVVGGQTNPFAAEVHVELLPVPKGRTVVYYLGDGTQRPVSQLTADTLGPGPLSNSPKTIALRDSLEAGEGVWTSAGPASLHSRTTCSWPRRSFALTARGPTRWSASSSWMPVASAST